MNATISSSDGTVLVFQCQEQLKEYQNNLELLKVETYKKIRDKHGVFAGNQNKFVKNRCDLNKRDSMVMENLYDKYYDTE